MRHRENGFKFAKLCHGAPPRAPLLCSAMVCWTKRQRDSKRTEVYSRSLPVLVTTHYLPTSMASLEWKSRKSHHTTDPLPAARELQLKRAKPVLHGQVVAKCGSIVVARTSELQLASGRSYFPLSHCNLGHFEASGKRWR